jgi:PKD domain
MFGSTVITAPLGRNLAVLGSAVVVTCLVLSASLTAASPSTLVGAVGSGAMVPRASSSLASPPAPPVSSAPQRGSGPAAAPVLSAAGDTPAAISLSWTDTTTGTFENYTVEEASAASGWALAALTVITAATTTSYVASGISPGTDYDWQVAEHYETGVVLPTQETATTNLLNVTQPSVAFLNYTGLTATSVDLAWTNNATYGGLISFGSYEVYETKDGVGPTMLPAITDATTRSYMAALTSGDNYSLYLETSDCIAGCSGGSPTYSVTQSNIVTLGTPEPLEVTVFAEHSTIDLGQSDYLTCTPSGGESPFSYEWNFSGAGYAPGNASETFTFSGTGAQTAECKISDAEPASNSNTADVEVDPPLLVVASLNRSSADVGQGLTFICYATGGTIPYTLLWSFGDGGTSPVGNLTRDYLAAGSYAPSCEVSDNVGSTQAPAFALLVSPTLMVTATSSSSAAAPLTSLTFTADPVNGSGTYSSYTWNFGQGGPGSGPQVAHAFTSVGEQIVGVTVIDSNGARASASVGVNVSDVADVVSPTPKSVTTGSEITFSASASGGAGSPYNYTWSFGDGAYGFGATVRHVYTSTGTVDPRLVVTDRLGATNATAIPAIDVAAPPAPLAGIADYVILGLAVAVAIVVGVIVLSRRRAAEAAELEAGATWVPPTDPKRTIKGRKVCPSCGATNLPIRSTCSHCGKPLHRTPT